MTRPKFDFYERERNRELKRIVEETGRDFTQLDMMEKLRESLSRGMDTQKNNPLSEGKEMESYFYELAKFLMSNFVIEKGDCIYEFADIEFYYYSPLHKDITTYPRHMEAGRFFFHNSGVDVTFQSVKYLDEKELIDPEISEFGGILIKGLNKREKDGKLTKIIGPLKCVEALWDEFNALERDEREYPVIVYREVETDEIIAKKRHYKVEENKKIAKVTSLNKQYSGINYSWENLSYFLDLKYRFIRKDF